MPVFIYIKKKPHVFRFLIGQTPIEAKLIDKFTWAFAHNRYLHMNCTAGIHSVSELWRTNQGFSQLFYVAYKKRNIFCLQELSSFLSFSFFCDKTFSNCREIKRKQSASGLTAVICIKNSREMPRRRIVCVVKKKQYSYYAIFEQYLPDKKASENSEDKRTGADHQHHDL